MDINYESICDLSYLLIYGDLPVSHGCHNSTTGFCWSAFIKSSEKINAKFIKNVWSESEWNEEKKKRINPDGNWEMF